MLNQSWFMEICWPWYAESNGRWSGNAGTDTETGKPIIYDPAAFYAHNEYEIGIQKVAARDDG
jgi:Fructosamine kinase